jgi:hypothetical protein
MSKMDVPDPRVAAIEIFYDEFVLAHYEKMTAASAIFSGNGNCIALRHAARADTDFRYPTIDQSVSAARSRLRAKLSLLQNFLRPRSHIRGQIGNPRLARPAQQELAAAVQCLHRSLLHDDGANGGGERIADARWRKASILVVSVFHRDTLIGRDFRPILGHDDVRILRRERTWLEQRVLRKRNYGPDRDGVPGQRQTPRMPASPARKLSANRSRSS